MTNVVVGYAPEYAALRHDVGAVELDRDFVMVHGADARTFLQGQLSQDVLALDVGSTTWSLLLQPQGKVDAFVRVTRSGDDAMMLDIDGGFGDALIARLNRFKLRVKAELIPVAWRCVALRGPRSHDVGRSSEGALAVGADWPGLDGVDLIGPTVRVPDGVMPCGPLAYEAVRIESGMPRMGAELDESTIPAEAGLVERSVSFTKGCFTGQELVARIDSRGGNVPRRLRGIVVGDGVDTETAVGTAVEVDSKVVGTLTSVAYSPDLHATVALAYVHRSVEAPAAVTLRIGEGTVAARVEELPLLR